MGAQVIRVVGMKADRRREQFVSEVRESDPVMLVPEPDNPHDADAVAIYHAPMVRLTNPKALMSSLKDPEGVGHIDPTDRLLFLDRQVGYVPAVTAARLVPLPERGIVGVVWTIRYAPTEYLMTRQGEPKPLPPWVAGFDLVANLTFTDTDEAA